MWKYTTCLKKYSYLLILILFFSCSVSAISLNLNQPTGTLEIVKGNAFNVLATVNCDSSSGCYNFSVGLKIPNLEKITHDFSGAEANDCFGGTCLTKPEGNGPLYTLSGNSNWGLGKCFSGPVWVGSDMKQLAGKIGGMRNIEGVDLCFETDSGEKWDLQFSSWPVGGIGNFVYTRSIERGLLTNHQSSFPFYFNSEENPLVLNLNSGESYHVNFSIVAVGNVGNYSNLVLFASDREANLPSINIKSNDSVQNSSTSESTKITAHHSSNKIYSDSIQVSVNNPNKTISSSEEEKSLLLTGDVSKSKDGWNLFWIISGIVLLVLLILVFLLKRKDY